LTYRQF